MKTMHEMYVEGLRDVYDAEGQIVKALEMMEKSANNARLQQGFRMHREETEMQRGRLEQIFTSLGESPKGKTCKGMAGIITENQQHMGEAKDPQVLDAVLIAGAQKVEHYEISAYGTLRTLAQQMGRTQDAELLNQSLDEEYATDKKLSALAEGRGKMEGLNEKAIQNGGRK
jgi:ferritin-like metal-binding protein YciE